MTALTDQTADAARFVAHYVKAYGAGAFASPTAKELTPRDVVEWRNGEDRVVGIAKVLRATSRRTDFTGREMRLPAGSLVLTHLAATPGAALPSLRKYDYVVAYAEDHGVSDQLSAQGRTVHGVQVTAASEILNVWALPGNRHRYAYEDEATVTEVNVPLSDAAFDRVLREAMRVSTWHDDFPYYSDGSWSAAVLRGFSDDPTVGVKPSEMPRVWRAEHPEMLDAGVRWTSLGRLLGATRGFVESVPWWRKTERIRLLRMAGAGKKPSRLARHTDITDRAAGLATGQIARFHIPLVTHPDVVMHTWGLDGIERVTHLEAGRCYYLDARKPHAVVNPTDVDRVHLVVDVVSSEQVRGHVADAEVQRQAAAVVR